MSTDIGMKKCDLWKWAVSVALAVVQFLVLAQGAYRPLAVVSLAIIWVMSRMFKPESDFGDITYFTVRCRVQEPAERARELVPGPGSACANLFSIIGEMHVQACIGFSELLRRKVYKPYSELLFSASAG